MAKIRQDLWPGDPLNATAETVEKAGLSECSRKSAARLKVPWGAGRLIPALLAKSLRARFRLSETQVRVGMPPAHGWRKIALSTHHPALRLSERAARTSAPKRRSKSSSENDFSPASGVKVNSPK